MTQQRPVTGRDTAGAGALLIFIGFFLGIRVVAKHFHNL
jgi:hypothetical protein